MEMPESACNKASILVNCAGITRDGKISNISDREWEDVIGVNLRGTFNTCQAFCETERVVSLLTSGNRTGGSIVNIGSIVSKYGNAGQVNYSASKGGVVGLTRSLAKEMALLSCKIAGSNGTNMRMPAVRVNCIQPGMLVCLSW
jgi:3-oxoacyl-[acyl-carrier protein] reductase